MSGQHLVSNRVLRDRLRSSMWANILLQPLIMALSVAGSVIVARVLGPELWAVVALVAATALTINSFFDLGLARSLPKLMPDVSIRFGQRAALRIQRRLSVVKLALNCLGFIGLLGASWLGLWRPPEGLTLSVWFFPLVGAKVLLGAVLAIYQSSAIAAFHNRLANQFTLFLTALDPILSVGAVLLMPNPYLVAGVLLVPTVIEILLLRRFARYDLDRDVSPQENAPTSWGWLFKEYWRYVGMTYLVFLFNRFVYGLPLTLWLLTILGAGANTIGNVALAVSIVGRGWDVANMPLANLRAPLLARLHAEGDAGRFFRHQRLMVAVLILTSGPLAVALLALGPLVFGLLYGAGYAAGVSWGVIAGVVALVANFFTLGNSTLHQTNRFLPELAGLAASAIFIVGNGLIAPRLLSQANWPLAVVLGYVIGRAIFWVITDLWVDARIFNWDGTAVKLRGLLAVAVALGGTLLMGNGEPIGQVVAAVVGLVLFWGVFRLLGGVGEETRGYVADLLGSKIKWAGRFL